MQLPPAKSSVGTRLRYSRTVAANLTADDKAHGLAAAVRTKHNNLKAKQTAVNDAEDEGIDARAFVNRAARKIGIELSSLQLSAAVAVGRDYQAELYRTLFTMGVPELRKLMAADLLKQAERMAGELAKQPKDSALWVHGKTLTELNKAMTPLLASLTKAEQVLKGARTARDTGITQWEQQLDSTYGALKQLFPRQRTFIESFFPKPGKRAEKVEPAPV